MGSDSDRPDIAPDDEAARARLAELNDWKAMQKAKKPSDIFLDVVEENHPGFKKKILDQEAGKGLLQFKRKR